MIFQTLSFRNFIALIFVIQCLMIPVSSIRCVHCMADKEGNCLVPFSKKSYEVDCTMHMMNRLMKFKSTYFGKTLYDCLNKPSEQKEPVHLKMKGKSTNYFICITAEGRSEGEKFILKDCGIRGYPCEASKLVAAGGFYIESCETCSTELCNSANNPHISIAYFLPAVVFLYTRIH